MEHNTFIKTAVNKNTLMKPEELAAYIGAAAWLPTIIGWLANTLTKPRLRVLPDSTAEIGFTPNGPIFNARMAFAVEKRDIIIDCIAITIRHKDGDTREFRWQGLAETLGQTTDTTAGITAIHSRDQSPIAIKVITSSLFEKFVRFQVPAYHDANYAAIVPLIEMGTLHSGRDAEAFAQIIAESRELANLMQVRQNAFPWKVGRYEVVLTPTSMQKFLLRGAKFTFDLRQDQINSLRGNMDKMRDDVMNLVNQTITGRETVKINWNWATVSLISSTT